MRSTTTYEKIHGTSSMEDGQIPIEKVRKGKNHLLLERGDSAAVCGIAKETHPEEV